LSSQNSYSDAIPLRNQSKLGLNEEPDHVYDAPPPPPPPLGSGREPRRLPRGLGFFQKDGTIPFVVYTFTIIQLAVFIAELVKNGMPPKTRHVSSTDNT
jgi:hypothetical protein